MPVRWCRRSEVVDASLLGSVDFAIEDQGPRTFLWRLLPSTDAVHVCRPRPFLVLRWAAAVGRFGTRPSVPETGSDLFRAHRQLLLCLIHPPAMCPRVDFALMPRCNFSSCRLFTLPSSRVRAGAQRPRLPPLIVSSQPSNARFATLPIALPPMSRTVASPRCLCDPATSNQ
jgi:hypothetical protein